MIYISRDVYNRIWEYYLNVYRKYSNTWTYNKSITFFRWISSFCRAISSKSVYCKTPFLREWRRLGLTQIYFKETNWYFGFKEDGGDIYVYKCEYGDCMVDKDSNNASLYVVQSPKEYTSIGNAGYGFQIVKGKDGTFNYINSDRKLLYPCQWFKEVKPFKKTKQGILAFVNNNGICNAIDSNGTIYDMNRSWKDCFTEGKIKKDIMTEAINKISNTKRIIRLTESELKGIITESVKQVIKTLNESEVDNSYKPIGGGHKFTDKNGTEWTSVMTIKAPSGQMCHFVEDDHCYLLFNDDGEGKNCSDIKWIFPEAFEALKSLPPL